MRRFFSAFLVGISLGSSLGGSELSLEEKIGQLFLAPACPERMEDHHLLDLKTAIEKWHLGGFLLKVGTIEQTRVLIHHMQKQAFTPLLIAADAEWGLTMRIPDAPRYPRNMTLGAIQDLGMIEQMGKEVALQMKSLGIHLNLAPVVDVNSNPQNPIIYMRSFGDDPVKVANRGKALVKGLQEGGVLATAKHFPGHGDTALDSHLALPCIDKTLAQMQTVELLPFKALIDQGISCLMTAHLLIPQVDETPVTLSRKWVAEILQENLHFAGLVITDALNMKGIAHNRDPGEVAVEAFLAGHHLLLYGDHINPNIDEILQKTIPTAIEALKNAVQQGRISLEDLDARVEKILEAKRQISTETTSFPERTALPSLLYREALTKIGELPLLTKATVIELGKERQFAERLQREGIESGGETILVFGEKNSGLAAQAIEELKPCVIVLFGSPYLLSSIPKEIPVLLAYEETPDAWDAAALALSGKIPCNGRLPVKH